MPGRRRPGPRARSPTTPTASAGRAPAARPSCRTSQAKTRAEAVRHARLGQPLRRGVPRRARPRLGRAALRAPRHRQPAGDDAHRRGAQKLTKRTSVELEDPDLAYLVEGTPEFDAYIADMLWAQGYACGQPRPDDGQRAARALRVLRLRSGRPQRINCHHNFTERELHDGRELWITRKGAIRADTGDLGVIPGSMGTRTYIVAGKGNAASRTSRARTAPAVGTAGRRRRSSSPRSTSPSRWRARTWLSSRADALLDEHPDRLQGHRPGDGRPDRPGRGAPHAAPGPQLQGHLTRPPRHVPLGPGRAGHQRSVVYEELDDTGRRTVDGVQPQSQRSIGAREQGLAAAEHQRVHVESESRRPGQRRGAAAPRRRSRGSRCCPRSPSSTCSRRRRGHRRAGGSSTTRARRPDGSRRTSGSGSGARP